MTDHLQMKGKDALTIEEGRWLLAVLLDHPRWTTELDRASKKLEQALTEARDRRDTREGTRHLGAEAAKKASPTPEEK